ncbi:SurA N-terminal domain-containing protein [Streptomyces sp. NPDC050560]|uniref:SurA N-terminal domain-containing protein n=1 Tax=Streptomyces sp. NPDC050560 TaxID=3365630 RepID=UPI0037948935
MHRRRRTARTALLVPAAALLAAAPLLTACGSDAHPGTAAVVGGERITVSQVQNRVKAAQSALRSATGSEQQYQQAVSGTGTLPRTTLENMVLSRVMDRTAKDEGVTPSRAELQAQRAVFEQQSGGAKGLENIWLQRYNVAPRYLDENLRTELEARKIANKLGIDMNSQEGQNGLWKRLAETSKTLHVDLNPRYGTWDNTRSTRVDKKLPWLKDTSSAAAASPQSA